MLLLGFKNNQISNKLISRHASNRLLFYISDRLFMINGKRLRLLPCHLQSMWSRKEAAVCLIIIKIFAHLPIHPEQRSRIQIEGRRCFVNLCLDTVVFVVVKRFQALWLRVNWLPMFISFENIFETDTTFIEFTLVPFRDDPILLRKSHSSNGANHKAIHNSSQESLTSAASSLSDFHHWSRNGGLRKGS